MRAPVAGTTTDVEQSGKEPKYGLSSEKLPCTGPRTRPRGRPRRRTNGQAEARALFRAWQRDGDQRARERLVERYMPLDAPAREAVREGHRAARRPVAGGVDRVGERDRPLRRDSWPALRGLRRAHDPGRDAPLLPGLGLGAARPPDRQRAGAGSPRCGRRAARPRRAQPDRRNSWPNTWSSSSTRSWTRWRRWTPTRRLRWTRRGRARTDRASAMPTASARRTNGST